MSNGILAIGSVFCCESRPKGRGIVRRGFVSPQSFGSKLPRPKGRVLLFPDKYRLYLGSGDEWILLSQLEEEQVKLLSCKQNFYS